jgi:hypothetical protein
MSGLRRIASTAAIFKLLPGALTWLHLQHPHPNMTDLFTSFPKAGSTRTHEQVTPLTFSKVEPSNILNSPQAHSRYLPSYPLEPPTATASDRSRP